MIYIYIYMVSCSVFLPPQWYGSPGSTPFPSICKLLAAFLRSSLVFARFLQRFWLPASHLLGTCYLLDNLRSTHTPSKYLRATYSYVYMCYVSTSYIYIYIYIIDTYVYIYTYIHIYIYMYILKRYCKSADCCRVRTQSKLNELTGWCALPCEETLYATGPSAAGGRTLPCRPWPVRARGRLSRPWRSARLDPAFCFMRPSFSLLMFLSMAACSVDFQTVCIKQLCYERFSMGLWSTVQQRSRLSAPACSRRRTWLPNWNRSHRLTLEGCVWHET